MGPADLEIPEPAAEATEAAVGFVVELGGQVAGLAEREVNAFVEVLAGLAVSPDDLIGDEGLQECPQLVLEAPGRQRTVRRGRSPLTERDTF